LLLAAMRQLERYGEHRTMLVCRYEIGAWRLHHGDVTGLTDIAAAARALVPLDPFAAAIACAELSEAHAANDPERSATLAAAATALADRGAGAPPSHRAAAVLDAVRSRGDRDRAPDDVGLDELLMELEQA
jgi:hypothetical protein